MSMEDIIRSWKSDEETLTSHSPNSPIGRELSEQELSEVVGIDCGLSCTATCGDTCSKTCRYTQIIP